MRTDLVSAGTADPQATALYDMWHETRCRSLADLAALQCLVLAASAHGSLGRAAADLGALDGDMHERLRWATLIGQLVQCVWDGTPRTKREDREVVGRLWRAWEIAASSDPPIWASELANMPRLSRLNPLLPLDPSFRTLSAPAQLIAMEIAAWNGTRTELGQWSALAAANNLSEADARIAVAELETSGWAVCGTAASATHTPSVSVAVRIDERVLRSH